MPRRRHYSWPFSGPTSKAEEVRFDVRKHNSPLSVARAKNLTSSFTPFDRPFSPDLSLYSSSDDEDVLSSAGIVDSKSENRQRQRRKQLARRAESKRQRREQKRKPVRRNITELGEDDVPEEIIVSSITEASEAPTAMLRRFIWPHLEKARQFLLTIQTLHSLTRSWNPHARSIDAKGKTHIKNTAQLKSPSAPTLSITTSPDDEALLQSTAENDWMLRPGRRHRRCHSEQPRAWREPSPGLWTLKEE